jgi:hypothetical protein
MGMCSIKSEKRFMPEFVIGILSKYIFIFKKSDYLRLHY